MRHYSPETVPNAREWLERLAERPDPEEYGQLMERFGEELGRLAAGRMTGVLSLMLFCSGG